MQSSICGDRGGTEHQVFSVEAAIQGGQRSRKQLYVDRGNDSGAGDIERKGSWRHKGSGRKGSGPRYATTK